MVAPADGSPAASAFQAVNKEDSPSVAYASTSNIGNRHWHCMKASDISFIGITRGRDQVSASFNVGS